MEDLHREAAQHRAVEPVPHQEGPVPSVQGRRGVDTEVLVLSVGTDRLNKEVADREDRAAPQPRTPEEASLRADSVPGGHRPRYAEDDQHDHRVNS
ncbi:hypothetical protein EYF80_064251 [Liparis tanakae]|uniref:Uncharacterized protein n=1 Tax=Liparis tanakae TaxID=230148 RepID=A0A4Z2E9Y8_9TELE|nr:hypothetical protein EYF80_064251 [Liparis tanakae]